MITDADRFFAHTTSPGPSGDFALGAWNDRWIMSHEAVRCRYCLAPQWPSNADDPVHHCPGCAISELHYPIYDLARILSDLPIVKA